MALLSLLGLTTTAVGANAAPTPVGAGFTVTTADLACILKQIKIGEGRVSFGATGWAAGPDTDPPGGVLAAGRERVADLPAEDLSDQGPGQLIEHFHAARHLVGG
jgi:hypothetical protein